MANGSLLDQPGDRNLVDSLAGNSYNRQAMQRPHGGAAATVTYDQQAHASERSSPRGARTAAVHIVATTGGIVDPADLTALADAHLVPSPIMTARTSKITALSGGRDG